MNVAYARRDGVMRSERRRVGIAQPCFPNKAKDSHA